MVFYNLWAFMGVGDKVRLNDIWSELRTVYYKLDELYIPRTTMTHIELCRFAV